ncbi:MAG: type II toxin-antitoxin system prevent-host-death family antitoxin [Gemmatimonas sp.]
MKTISLSEAKNSLSALVREIRGGSSIVITDRGVPVAQLTPVGRAVGVSPSAIELAQQGRLRLPAAESNVSWRNLPIAQPKNGASAVAMLLAERDDSR